MSQLPDNILPLHTHQEYASACKVLAILEHEWMDKYLTRTDADLKWAAKEIAELQLRINNFAGKSQLAQSDFGTTLSSPKVSANLLSQTIREWQNKP